MEAALRVARLEDGSGRLRVDEDGGQDGGLGATVDTGVVGAALDHDIAGLEVDLAPVEQHRHPPRDQDDVIDRRRLAVVWPLGWRQSVRTSCFGK